MSYKILYELNLMSSLLEFIFAFTPLHAFTLYSFHSVAKYLIIALEKHRNKFLFTKVEVYEIIHDTCRDCNQDLKADTWRGCGLH